MRTHILDDLFRSKCLLCRTPMDPGQRRICPKCLYGEAAADVQRSGRNFEVCWSPMTYTDNVRRAILQFKFHDQPGAATEFGHILSDCIRRHLQGQYDLITWVPVSQQRLRQRGYDQSMLIALAAALEKTVDIPAQSTLQDEKARLANVQGVYRALEPELIRDRRILLIDDVITSGATLEEAAGTLRDAGAKRVLCATLVSAHPE